MKVLERMQAHDHEQVIAFQNRATGLRGFLAIHDTTLGPALGGVRIWRYAAEEEALADALRLSRAMTYKAALAELPCGGGKTVVLLHDALQRTAAFEALGAMIEGLHGRYFAGRDVGITDDDLAALARTTGYVAREPSPELGDISEHTAIGLWHGLRACLDFCGLKKARVAIQGVGSVGLWLARILKREGMGLAIADIDPARAALVASECGAEVIPPERILATECDALAPCALGGVLTAEAAEEVRAAIVCGSANNILASPEVGDSLARRGILYAPDYLVNAGGLIRGAEYYLLGRADSRASLEHIFDRMLRVARLARERGISPARIAGELAEARLRRPKSFRELTWSYPLGPLAGD
jgi:leucine dehydrogenase